VQLDFQPPHRCDNSGPNCLEVAQDGGDTYIRDSKTGGVMKFDGAEFAAFVESAKAGQYDL
jgi:hypothetical protein